MGGPSSLLSAAFWLGACTLLGVEQAPIEGHTPMSVRAQRSDAQNRSSGACEYSYAVQRAGACVCLRALVYSRKLHEPPFVWLANCDISLGGMRESSAVSQ